MARGKGVRCHGFLSDDSRFAHCARPEQRGHLEPNPKTGLYVHKLEGDCRCGTFHNTRPETQHRRQEPEATYEYRDGAGRLLYQVLRYAGKRFRLRRPDGNGGWIWDMEGVQRVPYCLPELLSADPDAWVFIPEGEEDVRSLRSRGLEATTNSEGAGKWRDELSPYLSGRKMAILVDNDKPGEAHGQDKARKLYPFAAVIKVVELPGLPEKGDVSDWLAQGHAVEELMALVELAPGWSPETSHDSETGAGFTLTPLRDFLNEPPEIVRWLWEDTLPAGGVSVIVAKPKVGKSTFARNLALAAAKGIPFLGRTTSPGPVVYLALEEKRGELTRQFASLGGADEEIHVHVGGVPEEALRSLEQSIKKTGATLAVIDPLFKLIFIRDGNDYAELSRAMQPLILLARDTGCHLLLVHHAGKGERDGGDAILGSTAIFGAVDCALILKKRADGQRTLESNQRYGQDIPRTVLEFDQETGSLGVGGTVEELEVNSARQAILDAVSDGERTQEELRSLEGHKTLYLHRALKELVEEGGVHRQGAGVRGDPFRYSCFLVPDIYGEQGEQEKENTQAADRIKV